jgi:hypothetical protein
VRKATEKRKKKTEEGNGKEGHRNEEKEERTRKEVRKVTEKRKKKTGHGKMGGRTQKRGRGRQG